MSAGKALRVVQEEVCACRKCPRLVEYREKVAREKRRAFREWTYWGRGVPGFGDPEAKLFILGLAPAAHGGNRTGRVFTGDRSGDFLFEALHKAGFANQASSLRRDDGLELRDAYIAAAVRCAPPANRPLPSEILNCRAYLERELEILQPRAVLALGKIAWDAYLEILKQRGRIVSRSADSVFTRSGVRDCGRFAAAIRRVSPESAEHADGAGDAGDVCERVEADSKVFGMSWAKHEKQKKKAA